MPDAFGLQAAGAQGALDVTDGFAAPCDPGARNGPLAARRRLEIVFGPLVGLAALV